MPTVFLSNDISIDCSQLWQGESLIAGFKTDLTLKGSHRPKAKREMILSQAP
jgi:hypothetical protein